MPRPHLAMAATLAIVPTLLAGCAGKQPASPTAAAGVSNTLAADGYLHVVPASGQNSLACDGRALALDGSHLDITLTGNCRRVRITGEHNDITVDLAPAATVEITGAHDDVFWTQSHGGPAPRLLDQGPPGTNTFHNRMADN